ncbi:MAG TPA: hypothetical protein VLE95_05665 [Chlamydiales bacterium]|nr:hypothetical protein [Chlamydiales bacterium]
MPYTIVLTPPPEQAPKYVEVSQALYSHCQPRYLLNANGTSSPHITVVQFDCESPHQAEEVWADMCKEMVNAKFEPFAPLFVGVSFIEGIGPYEGTTWVELAVKRGEESSPIMKVHQAAVNVLKRFGIKPLNATGNDYRPHLTLARIVMPKQMGVWSKNIFENPGNFQLEFGLSDEHWQYARTLNVFSSLIEETDEMSNLNFDTGSAYWLAADPQGTLHGDINESEEPIEVMVIELKALKTGEYRILPFHPY